MCLEFADKILILAVSKQQLLEKKETEGSFCLALASCMPRGLYVLLVLISFFFIYYFSVIL